MILFTNTILIIFSRFRCILNGRDLLRIIIICIIFFVHTNRLSSWFLANICIAFRCSNIRSRESMRSRHFFLSWSICIFDTFAYTSCTHTVAIFICNIICQS
nr:MAG TPA_asm: hypothetical protein [Bacteriophage sp.]